ncbi:hypothetical protein V8F06_008031 [Rhypophila decipiens]
MKISIPSPTWALLCMSWHLASLAFATSTVYIKDSDTTFALNLPKDSEHVNFYMAVPDFYQYVAIGFGGSMDNLFTFIVYPNANRDGVTLSPRLSTGRTEPVFYPQAEITLNDGTRLFNQTLFVNATCTKGCRTWPGGEIQVPNPAQAMSFALGPSYAAGSDDREALLRRHQGYGSFGLDMVQASSTSFLELPPAGTSSGANLSKADVIKQDGTDKGATAHGVIFAIVALLCAPFDVLVAGALKKWPTLHMISSTIYLALVIGALVPGIQISRTYVMTQNFGTGHQILGLFTIVLMFVMAFWGIFLVIVKKGAKKRGEAPPEKSALLGKIHKYVGWLIWILFLINNGLGLKLADASRTFILGYAVMVGAVIVIMMPIYFIIWRCTRAKKDKEEAQELDNIYNHNYQNHHYENYSNQNQPPSYR